MNKTYFTVPAILLGLAVMSGVARASTFTFDDQNWVMEGHSRSDAIADWVDVIGDTNIYDTYSIDIKKTGNNINFNLNTNYSGQHHFVTKSDNTLYSMYMADLAIDADKDGTFELGVVLQDHSIWGGLDAPQLAGLSVGVYKVTDWYLSKDLYEESHANPFGGIGYGEYYSVGSDVYEPVVAIKNGVLVANLDVTQVTSTNVDPRYTYSFDVSRAILDTKEPGVLWATDTAASDVIATPSPVPEPATMLLFGTGLVGLVGSRRMRKKSA